MKTILSARRTFRLVSSHLCERAATDKVIRVQNTISPRLVVVMSLALARVKQWLCCRCTLCSRKYWISKEQSRPEVVAVQPTSNNKLPEEEKLSQKPSLTEPEDVPPPLPTSLPPNIDPLAPKIIFLELEKPTVTVIIPPSKCKLLFP